MENWASTFRTLYEEAVTQYESGSRGPTNVVPSERHEFLASIGMNPQEIYDFVEDWVEVNEPPFEVVKKITEVRRDYFVTVQQEQPSTHVVEMNALPQGGDKLGEYRWLPRIIAKAKAKLRGEMPHDLMYGCGADRPFLRSIGMEPDEFLRLVWEAWDDDEKILETIKNPVDSE